MCEPDQTRCGEAGRELCSDHGEWEAAPCGTGTQCVLGECLKSDGQSCGAAAECASDACTAFYLDADGDGFGSATAAKFCGGAPPAGYVTNDDDCCDSDAEARPGQEEFFTRTRTGCGGYDFDCVNGEERERTAVSLGCGSTGQSQAICRGWQTSAPACGQSGQHYEGCECTNASMSGCNTLCPIFQPSVQACR